MSTEKVQFVERKTLHAKCIWCNILLRKSHGQIRKIKTEVDAVKYTKILKRVVTIGDMLCNKCRIYTYKEATTTASDPENSQEFRQFGESTVTAFSGDRSFSTAETFSSAEPSSSVGLSSSVEPSSSAGPSSSAELSSSARPSSSAEPSSSSETLSATISLRRTSPTEILSPENSTDKSSPEKSEPESVAPSCSSTEDPSFLMDLRNVEQVSTEYIEMPFARIISTHRYCFVCGVTKNIVNVPAETRKQVFIMRRLYVPKGNRCCPGHLLKNRLFQEDVLNLKIHSNNSIIDTKELRNYFEYLSVNNNSNIKDTIGDFTLPEERLKVFTGLTWENLIKLREMMTSLRNSEQRYVTQAIVVFLFKLRTGYSCCFLFVDNNSTHSCVRINEYIYFIDVTKYLKLLSCERAGHHLIATGRRRRPHYKKRLDDRTRRHTASCYRRASAHEEIALYILQHPLLMLSLSQQNL